MRGIVFGFSGLLVLACGGETGSPTATDRIGAACARISDTICAKYVECNASIGSTTFTASVCADNRAKLIDSCRTDQADNLSNATDGDIDTCVTELSQTVCSDICNVVPVDPPTCHKISPEPNTVQPSCP